MGRLGSAPGFPGASCWRHTATSCFSPTLGGSVGQGWQFSEAVHRDWGGMDFQDVMDGVDSLVEQRIADPDRLGVGGWSYGGFLTASATTQTDRFKAAVVGANNGDLETYGLTTDITAWFQHMMGPTTLIGDETLARLSPLKHIDGCQTPTLVLHGKEDDRCPLYHGRAWYTGLKKTAGHRNGDDYLSAEGHVLSERSHQLDLMQRCAGLVRSAPQGPLTPCGRLLRPPDPNGTGPQLTIS